MTRVVGYIRVSKDEQAKNGVSLDNQREKLAAYCLVEDLELVEIFADEGVSAKDMNRPALQNALAMIEDPAQSIEGVVVYKLDRMFRSTMDAIATTEAFKKKGIAFHSIMEKLDTSSAIGEFFFTLTAAYAQMERALIAERTADALAHKKRNGEKTGGDTPYGFDVDEAGKLVPNKAEQKLVRKIRKMQSEKGMSLNKIASELNRLGYKTKRGGKWYTQTVKNTLAFHAW